MPRQFVPRDYQKLGLKFLLDTPRCSLWASMGLGKTSVTLTALEYLRLAGEGPALIIAPLRVARSVWPSEVRKWAHLQDFHVIAAVGTDSERRAALRQTADAHAINIENVPWLFRYLEEMGEEWRWPIVVVDEATRLKSMRASEQVSKNGIKFIRASGAKRARQLARVAHKDVRRWINLTGTPAPNGLADLWGPMWFVDKGARLGRTFEAFKERWFRGKHDGFGIEPLPFAHDQIHDRLRDVCLSIRTEDWFDVEKPVQTIVHIELPPKVRAVYRDMERELFAQIKADVGVGVAHAAARTNKCLQLAAGFIYDEERGAHEVHTEKLDALESIVEETAGEPLLVQYHFKPDLARILKRFPQARQLKTTRDEDDWNAGKIGMLVAHGDSCGHGLNLQDGGHILVRYSYWWALEAFEQILERIGPARQAQAGHNRAVHEYIIVARRTVDEDVLLRHETKRETQDILQEAMTRRSE